ncbi:MAG TPA: HEAT repeat domain-containing protein [Gammaproteobacteria bacterium]|nr:HEAT repeat domain-containing protein [Gammaproteobacteria bacterium]
MQSRNEEIEFFRKTLKLAKTDLYINGKLNRTLFSESISALSLIGKEKIYELSKEVSDLLDSSDEVVRETVVQTLGASTGLSLPEFKETAYKMWLEDEDANVRESALDAWSSYYKGTRNPEVLKILYKILIDENYPVDHRCEAMQDIFYVSQEPSNFYNPFNSRHFYMLASHEDFNQKVDWNEMKAIMKKYAPDALL